MKVLFPNSQLLTKIACLFLIMVTSCNLEKEIDIDLPTYEPQMVVECYLEPGKPYRLTLIESQTYFQPFELKLVNGATVQIKHQNSTYDLTFNPDLVFDTISRKSFNYTNPTLVPFDYNSEFTLFIRDSLGREINAKTKILPPVPIDTIEWKFNDDSLAFTLFRFSDDPATTDFYRVMVHDSVFYTGAERDFTFDDLFTTNNMISVGSNFTYEKNDTLLFSLFHIDKKYFEYLESVDAAIQSNGNPFAQPGSVTSGVEGGIGVFTGLSVDRKQIIIK